MPSRETLLSDAFGKAQKRRGTPGRAAMTIELVIFDCDGVLIDSEIISAQMLVAELSGFGVCIDLDYVATHFLGRSYPTVMQQIRQDFGLSLAPEFEDQYRERLMVAFESGLCVMPHAKDVLCRLAIPYCIATSSSPKRAQRTLDIAGLGPSSAGRLFTSTMVARGKPAPDLFLHAAAVMGVRPVACLVIEDSLSGIRAARAAGMTVWRFVGGSHLKGRPATEPEDARPDGHFASFTEFHTIDPSLLRPA